MAGRAKRRDRSESSGELFAFARSTSVIDAEGVSQGLTDFGVTSDSARSSTSEDEASPYAGFYKALGQLREDFHRIGRFDDANAKLDELCKLFVLKSLDSRHSEDKSFSRLSKSGLAALAEQVTGDASRTAAALHYVFSELTEAYPDEFSAFGLNPRLNLPDDDDEFANALIPVLESLPVHEMTNSREWSFDGVNEAFGHFIQDSFRNRKDDAQYMTPPEAVNAMLSIAFFDMEADGSFDSPDRQIVIADPTCGVGTFLASAYRTACEVGVSMGLPLESRLKLMGQDKVDRMVRLSAVNLKVLAQVNAEVRLGNSILPASSLADLDGVCDLIVTNPPFRASFATADILEHYRPEQCPTLFALEQRRSLPKTLDSEYILLDRELSLLRPGGRLMMVVPDHVVSASGFSEAFREQLKRRANLLAVIDLPTETFAQAGTRTKTSVVYLQRPADIGNDEPPAVFMAASQSLGYKVVSRAGATVKKADGKNDLPAIVDRYKSFRASKGEGESISCLCSSPSIAAVSADRLLNGRWTAGFYKTERLKALQQIESLDRSSFTPHLLSDIAALAGGESERVFADGDNRCISVLHVRENGCVDLQAVDSYQPTTGCLRCNTGDVLLSKINPRIPRICIVPEAPWSLGCSAEFAILRCDKQLSPWALALLLRSRLVYSQVTTLTSGTSSSHNRIKERDLQAIVVPIPVDGTPEQLELERLAEAYKAAVKKQYQSMRSIANCFAGIDEALAPRSSGG